MGKLLDAKVRAGPARISCDHGQAGRDRGSADHLKALRDLVVAPPQETSRDHVAAGLPKVCREVTPMDQAGVPVGSAEASAWVRAVGQVEALAWVRALTGSLIWLIRMAMVR